MSFKALVAKDAITARIIEQRMRRLIHLHETLAYWRVRIATNSKEWEEANKALRDEKDRLNKHYLDLKRTLDRLYTSEHQKLKAISKYVMNATKDLKNKLQLTERLQLLAKYNSRMETEAEKLFPFDPLHCSTIPTVPGMKLEQELALDDQSGKEIREDSHSTVAVVSTSMAVPSARHSSMMGIDIPPPSQDPEEPTSEGNPSDFRWSSYALDESGNEVEELSYLSKFNKRFNKVMLDKLANEMERNKLSEENMQLSTALANYLDKFTSPERTKTGYSALMAVKQKPSSPRQLLSPPYLLPVRKPKKVAAE